MDVGWSRHYCGLRTDMTILQGLIASISSSSGGTPPPPPPTVYPATLATTGGSLYFDATAQDQLSDPSMSTDYQVGTGDFTIEWWQWMLDTSGSFARPFSMGSYPNCILGMSFEGSAYFWANGSAVLPFSYTRDDLLNTWTHIAICRNGGTTKVFFNGVEQATTSVLYDVQSSDYFAIGNESTRSAGASFGGYIKDFRFIKGAGLYTTAFTPPVEQLTVTAETKLLLSVNSAATHQTDATGNHGFSYAGGSYADVGPYDLALYVDAGNSSSYSLADQTKWLDLSPAGNYLNLTNVSYSSSSSGSLLFDDGFGNGGYAITASTSLAAAQSGLTPRSSISFWANISSNNNFQHIAGMRGGDKFHVLLLNDNANLECRVETLSVGGSYFDNYVNISSRLGLMTHYAMVVNGTRTDTYVNGVLINTNENITGTNTGQLGALTIAQAAGGFQAQGLFMSELRYYNRARGPKEIAAEFAATRTRYGV